MGLSCLGGHLGGWGWETGNGFKTGQIMVLLCRRFELQLSSRKGLFERGLGVTSVGEAGKTTTHALDVSHFFHGEVKGEFVM